MRGKRFNLIFIVFLCLLMLIIYFPRLSYVPLGNDYALYYFFHNLDRFPGQIKWLHVLNYDPSEQMRYKPLSELFHYVFFLGFGSNFIPINIFSLLSHVLSVIIFYLFGLYLSNRKWLVALSTSLFAFLFNQSDVVLISRLTHISLGLSAFLLGFMSYINFLRRGKKYLSFLTAGCFLVGMWCYEPFAFWPLAILFISASEKFKDKKYVSRKATVKTDSTTLTITYMLYGAGFLFTRSLNTYTNPRYQLSELLALGNIVNSVIFTAFSAIYNNILINILPTLSFPLKYVENIYMGGPIINYISNGHQVILYAFGITALAILFYLFVFLYKKGMAKESKIIGFLIFLLFSAIFVILIGRGVLDNIIYGITELRYQYIPNAIIILLVIYILDKFLKHSRLSQVITCCAVAIVIALNIFCIIKIMNVYNRQLSDLRIMFLDIRGNIDKGNINLKDKLYIPDDIPEYLPTLCWNIEKGVRFMERTYQWIFPINDNAYFAKTLQSSSWVIGKRVFKVVRKSSLEAQESGKKIRLDKDRQYINLAHYYSREGMHKKAEEMFKEAIDINPVDCGYYLDLGENYQEQKQFDKANWAFKKALEANPDSQEASVALEKLFLSHRL